MMEQQPFTRMDRASPAQLRTYIEDGTAHMQESLIPTIVSILKMSDGPTYGAGLNRYQHSLQTATRAYRENARVDMVVGALLHDVGDTFATLNHGEVAAAILRKYVDEETTWVLAHHTVFQGYHFWDKLGLDPDTRDRYAGSPHFDATAHFCAEWDQVAFDPDYKTLPIEFFVPAMEEIFSRPVVALG